MPAEDYALAKQFYLDLGFTLLWGEEGVAAFQVGGFRFLLQNFYVKEWAGNVMMHLMVTDADASTSRAAKWSRNIPALWPSRQRCRPGAFAYFTSAIPAESFGT